MALFSIITTSFNSAKTIEDTLLSVRAQKDVSIEHIIIDGGSTDGTMDIVNKYRDGLAHVVSEPDKGIYDAMNKGLVHTTGEFTGFLNSDDYFASDQSLSKLAAALESSNADCAWGSIAYVDETYRPTRKMDGKWFTPDRFKYALMPPHPAFYVKTQLIKQSGGFDPAYKIAGDFDLMLRLFLKAKISSIRVDDLITIMRMGGVSTKDLAATRTATLELYNALKNNAVVTSIQKVQLRYLLKTVERLTGLVMALQGKSFAPPSAQTRAKQIN
jgi:glycosyltransferase involved in cell wall biosynthesis